MKTINAALRLILAVSWVALIWSMSFYFVSQAILQNRYRDRYTADDLSSLLGVSSLAVVILVLAIGVITFFGWQAMIRVAQRAAAEEVKHANQLLHDDLMGRLLTFHANLLGQLSVDPESNHDRLSEAIRLSQQAYDMLKAHGGLAELMALNNLVYYSAVAGERYRADFLLKSSRRLMEAGQEHNVINMQLTAAKVILQYGTDAEEARKSRDILIEIVESKNSSQREKNEAQRYLNSLAP